jgi:dihydroorotate dehydrogenase electron transfer subunit
MFAAMHRAAKLRGSERDIQVLLEERMGCGTSICYGCAIRTRKGMQLVCKDGPMFRLADLAL